MDRLTVQRIAASCNWRAASDYLACLAALRQIVTDIQTQAK
jgi:hypothetical protein